MASETSPTTDKEAPHRAHRHLPAARLQELLDALHAKGYRTLGPELRDGVISIDAIQQVEQLPRGVRDTQHPGSYRCQTTDDPRFFLFNVGAASWKPHLFPTRRLLCELDANLIATSAGRIEHQPMAFLGVRACDLAAIEIQNRVFDGVDADYKRRLDTTFMVAVHCQSAANTCFCTSAGTGPDFPDSALLDLTLTEIVNDEGHFFIARPHSERGTDLLAALDLNEAGVDEVALIDQQLDRTRAQISRSLPDAVATVLRDNAEAAYWDDIADVCLACGNCTFVCPTCFCSDVQEHTDLHANTAQRWQVWDSCFNQAHSYTHAGSVRESTRARYRQWLTHKLSSWHEQFGTSGCTGCGRCVTWCPVGIDLTQVAAAIDAEAASAN